MKPFVRAGFSLLAGMAITLTACSESEPALPSGTDPVPVHDFLAGPDANSRLLSISTYDWPNGGAQAGAYFAWIGRDATSPDQTAATRAGESAHVLATFLAANESDLTSMSPELVAAYGSALAPFQGAMVGDDAGVRGFGTLGSSSDLASARDVFGAIGSDGDAGGDFVEKAYARAAEIGATAATEGCRDTAVAGTVGPPALRAAAELSGLAASADAKVRDRRPAVDDVSYAMASACLKVSKQPPQGRITDYIVDGALLTPEAVFTRDLTNETYFQSLRDYLSGRGLSTGDFSDWYDKALGR